VIKKRFAEQTSRNGEHKEQILGIEDQIARGKKSEKGAGAKAGMECGWGRNDPKFTLSAVTKRIVLGRFKNGVLRGEEHSNGEGEKREACKRRE